MSLVIMFYFTSSMHNTFRTLIHPSSEACAFSIESPLWSCVLVSMCVGVLVWLGWGGIRVAGQSAQHVSDINTSIMRSLRLFYWITTFVVCSCFNLCWNFGVAGLGWYPSSRLKHNVLCFSLLPDTTPTQPHRNSNTHRNKNTRPMWW